MPSLIETGLLVLEKKIFKNFQYLLLFCDYLPFEEDLALYLNNLKSPLPKDDMPSLIEIGLLVLKKKIFFNINTCKYGFPYCGPPTPGDHDVNNFESALYQKALM